MKKAIVAAIFIPILQLVSCKSSEENLPFHIFVKKGEPREVNVSEGKWVREGKFLKGSGINNYLVAGKSIDSGNFRIHVRMKIDSLNSSAASFMLAGSHFGFDSKTKDGEYVFFAEGPLFGENMQAGSSAGMIKPGKPFDFDIIYEGKELSFSIDRQNVLTTRHERPVTGTLAIRPHRNTVNISDFYVSGQMKPLQPLNYVFESGTGGYNTFRIPAIVKTSAGTLLAFAEGRKNSASDSGDIDLVARSSDDNGKTWSDIQVIWDDGNNVCGNPAPVVDRATGNIYLLCTWNLGSDHESEIIKGTSRDTRRVFVIASADNGRTWSEPTEITSSVKPGTWTWYATGPCHGIQLANGKYRNRLVIPCDHIESGTNKYFSHVIFSDDHGKTWKTGGTTPQDQVNECSVAELPGGHLILNMRNYDRKQKARKVTFSSDGGETWSSLKSDTVLIEPVCQGSIISNQPHCDKLMFLNPADKDSRKNMTLRLSADEGATWASKVIFPGPSAYSDIVILSDEKAGCLIEAGHVWPYQGIAFMEVPFSELLKE